MECNKEEAIRAKEIAERKMLNKDFIGARKIVLKAQRLFPGLENISQMLTICDVHCASDTKINGETDWYQILQVNQTADDLTIKKQYRKLALLLHPDKNKFCGAESAFKFIGEARRVLSDKAKRATHDMKRGGGLKSVSSSQSTPQPSNTVYTTKQTGDAANFRNSTSNEPTFWTMCQFCFTRFQFYLSTMNKALRCQNCKMPFIAHNIKSQQVPAPNNAPNKSNGNCSDKGPQKNAFKSNNESRENGKVDDTKFENVKHPELKKKEQALKPSVENRNQKRGRKKNVESSKSMSSENDVIIDDNPVSPTHKKSKLVSTSAYEEVGKAKDVSPSSLNPNSSSCPDNDIPPAPDSLSYPDPEFYDFGKEREERNFAVDQIWAIYDNFDSMPRYYALIKQIYGPEFKVRFNWLEYDPISKVETVLFEGGLPVGCGSFKVLGKSEHTQERLMFSHLMHCTQGTKKNTYNIFPRKNEVWALFKNLDIELSSFVDKDRQYEFEIVEILLDLTESDAIIVAPLVKVHGFVSLFVQARLEPIKIYMKDMLQFSHKIPSYRLLGNERDGIPKGSFELDCASLPPYFVEFTSTNHGRFKSNENISGLNNYDNYTCKRDGICNQKNPSHPNTTHHTDEEILNFYEYPEPEFHNFEVDKSIENFEVGQIWALYSDVDKNPNYYGQISKIKLDKFEVHVTWLEGYPEQEQDKTWFREQLPSGCGSFKVVKDTALFNTTDSFSHIMHANPKLKKNHYIIYPRVGEIWAFYKNWSHNWTLSDLEKSEFEIAEIRSVSSSGFKISVLSKVNGYTSVFKSEGITGKIIDLPLSDHLKFSHKIPAFRLTEESGGKLRGYWELDPASVPEAVLISD